MPGHLISAHVDERTLRRAFELAKLADRTMAEVVTAALRFYVRLPRSAHDVYRQFEAVGENAAEAAAWAAGRALLNLRYDQAMARGVAAMDAPDTEEDEEALLARAMNLVRPG